MKKVKFLLPLLFVAAIVPACKESNDAPEPFKLAPFAYINAATKPTTKGYAPTGVMTYEDSVRTIVRYASEWYWYNSSMGHNTCRGIGIEGKDTINHRLIWEGDEIIKPVEGGGYKLGVLLEECTNYILTAKVDDNGKWWDTNFVDGDLIPWEVWQAPSDTVAYIPNSVISAAKAKVEAALAIKDYAKCIEVFNHDLIFIPVTGKRYKELKAAGVN